MEKPSQIGWISHSVKEEGLIFQIPKDWQLVNEVNGKVDVKQNQEALAQARQQFDDIRMVASASETESIAKKLLTTFTILSLKPKAMPKSPEDLLKSTLSDLVADYPSGDPKGVVFEGPLGKSVLTSYTDAATKGQSKGGAPDVVSVMNIQFRVLHGDRILLLNVTGEASRTQELQTLAESLLKRITFS